MRFARIDIVNKRFGSALFGYRKNEVREFLQWLVADMDEQAAEIRRLTESSEAMHAEVERYRKLESAISEAMVTAQKIAEEVRSTAQEDARRIVDAAQTRATALETEASRSAEALRQQRQRFLRDFRDLLQSHLDTLSGEITRREDEGTHPTVTSLPPMQFTAKPSTDGAN